jgi:hypothetical protein
MDKMAEALICRQMQPVIALSWIWDLLIGPHPSDTLCLIV